jgi:hypothetical protein
MMPKSTRAAWKYVAIPAELAEQISVIVEKDHYPMGKWHSKDHFVIDALKKTLTQYEGTKVKLHE